MRYRLVIFDFDGTLADSFPWFLGVFGEVAARYRFRAPEEQELHELRALGGRDLVTRLGVAAWKLPLIARHMRALKARDAAAITLFPGTDLLLRCLTDAAVPLAIVSSNAQANVRRILGEENAARISHYECGLSLFGKGAGFRRVLRASGVPAGAALAVGDEIRDIEAARAAGIPFGAVSWGYTSAPALAAAGATHAFADMAEIARTVLG